MKQQPGGKKRPLQSRSAENLRPPQQQQPYNNTSAAAGAGGMSGRKGGVGKSRSTQELVSDCLREREPHSPPPREPTARSSRNGNNRRPPPGRAGSAPPAVERPLSKEERERAVEAMHREFCARRKAVINGIPPGTREEVSLSSPGCSHVIHSAPAAQTGHRRLSGELLMQDSLKVEGTLWYARMYWCYPFVMLLLSFPSSCPLPLSRGGH